MKTPTELGVFLNDEYQRQCNDPERYDYFKKTNPVKLTATPHKATLTATFYNPGDLEHVLNIDTARKTMIHMLTYVNNNDGIKESRNGRQDNINAHITKGSAMLAEKYHLTGNKRSQIEQLANGVLQELKREKYTLESLCSMTEHTFECIVNSRFNENSPYKDIIAAQADYNDGIMTSAESFNLAARLYGSEPDYELASTTISSMVLKKFKPEAECLIKPQGFSEMNTYMKTFENDFAAPYVARGNIHELIHSRPEILALKESQWYDYVCDLPSDDPLSYHTGYFNVRGYNKLLTCMDILENAAMCDASTIDHTLPVFDNTTSTLMNTEADILYKIKCGSLSLKDVENQTEEMCLAALDNDVITEIGHLNLVTDAIVDRLTNLKYQEELTLLRFCPDGVRMPFYADVSRIVREHNSNKILDGARQNAELQNLTLTDDDLNFANENEYSIEA